MIPIKSKHTDTGKNLMRAGLLVLAVFFVAWRFDAVRKLSGEMFFAVAMPLWRAEESFFLGAGGEWTSLFASKQSLVAARSLLEEKNAFLGAKLSRLRFLEEENKELKEALARREPEARGLLARILVHPNRSPYNSLVIDIGEHEGARIGDIVSVYGEIAIGKVTRVYAHSSVVAPFASFGETIQIFLGERRIPLTAQGMGGGDFEARLPKDVVVKEGDTVVFPDARMLLGGIVGAVRITPSDPFQHVLFQTPTNIYELTWVQVISKDAFPPVDTSSKT